MTDDWLNECAKNLRKVYYSSFRGKDRGRFTMSREQMRICLGVQRLHGSTVKRFQDAALESGLVIIDMDDLFPVILKKHARNYRRPPANLWSEFFPEEDDEFTEEDEG